MKRRLCLLLFFLPVFKLSAVKHTQKGQSPLIKAIHKFRRGYGAFLKELQEKRSPEIFEQSMNKQCEDLIEVIADTRKASLLKRGFNRFDFKPHQHFKSHQELYAKVMKLIVLRTEQTLHYDQNDEIAQVLIKKIKKISESNKLFTDNQCKIRPIFSHFAIFLQKDREQYPGYDGSYHLKLGVKFAYDLKKICDDKNS